jgi:peptidoglycan/xylan/chitin deacetylase (PgdA/CDA1 family)
VEERLVRRIRQRRARRRRRVVGAFVVGLACIAGPMAVAGFRPESIAREQPATQADRQPRHVHHPPARPPQFVVVSFDGSGGTQLWPYWRTVARKVHAHFTFFVSGVYLLDWAHGKIYHPPRHAPGRSDIGFAPTPDVVRGTLEQIAGAYREGHEIGTHFNGHFCAPYSGNVGEWNAADWRRELEEFDKLLFDANANVGLVPHVELPFGPKEIVGERTPCLQGTLPILYRVLARKGFRYDASRVGRLGDWPQRERGLWSVPLVEIPFVGHTFPVVSMDYNFLANQEGSAATVERETYLSLRRAFRTVYEGNRAPLSIGYHFETWHDWAYDRALTRFLTETCDLPEVRCAGIRELVDWLDLKFPRLRLYPH